MREDRGRAGFKTGERGQGQGKIYGRGSTCARLRVGAVQGRTRKGKGMGRTRKGKGMGRTTG